MANKRSPQIGSADTVTAEVTENLYTQRHRESNAYRSERYRLACQNDPDAVVAYEAEILRRIEAGKAKQSGTTG